MIDLQISPLEETIETLAISDRSEFELPPFGEADCAAEVLLLKEKYSDYYFSQTRFNWAALDPKSYLIIGRRGSGKTALSQYFTFQSKIRNAIAIDVDEPELFHDVMRKISSNRLDGRSIEIPRLMKVWEFCIWLTIFSKLRDHDPRILAASFIGSESGKLAHFIVEMIKAAVTRFVGEEGRAVVDEFESLLGDARVQIGREAVIELAKKRPIIIAIDTLENYSIHDDAMMRAVASLIQFGSAFNRAYSVKNIHLKIFVMAETYPYLKEEVVLNPLKHIRNEVFLHWRPKDLMRLICWRLYYFLRINGLVSPSFGLDINWRDHRDVFRRMWVPYFGESLVNGNGLSEKTFPYVLRHIQMRPRQLIVLCNSIAKSAKLDSGVRAFTGFTDSHLVKGIRAVESHLAGEVYSAYSEVYPRVSNIVEALTGIPMIFKGSELDKRAYVTASQWKTGQSEMDYSPYNFRQLVAELGIVGRVRRKHADAGYVEADFEYTTEDRLPLLPTDECVIHPMFYQNLAVKIDHSLRIYPFPDHPEFQEYFL